MKTVYQFLADGFEEVEAIAPLDICRRAGIPFTTVSVSGSKTVTGAHGVPVAADALFDELPFDDAAMLLLPGGMPGSLNLAGHAPLNRLIEREAAAGTPLAAICAAPLVYGRLGLLAGRRATCYPGFEGELAGATYTAAAVERDGNIITANGPAAAPALGFAIVEYFLGADTVSELRAAMQFK